LDFTFTILFTLTILLFLLFKKRKKNEKINFNKLILITLCVLLLSKIFFFLFGTITSFATAYFFEKKYEAKVVKYEYTDGDSESEPTKIAIVEFKNEQNKIVQKSIGYGTSHPIEIGKTIKITYKEGDKYFTNMNLGEQKLIVSIVVIFFVIFAMMMVVITLYSLDKDLYLIYKTAAKATFYFIIPTLILSLLYAIISSIWESYQGKSNEISIWALGFCCFFCLTLISVLIGYFRILFKK